MKKQSSQNTRVLERLMKAPLTPIESWMELGVYRLAARINELREKGYKIGSRSKQVSNRFGEKCRVSEYYLE